MTKKVRRVRLPRAAGLVPDSARYMILDGIIATLRTVDWLPESALYALKAVELLEFASRAEVAGAQPEDKP